MTKKHIFTNGCFDVLHRGHLELFKQAKRLGDVLIVGVDSDEKIKLDKGSDRPYNKLDDRVEMLKSLKFIDEVYAFGSTRDLELLIKKISPDILIIGSDWRGKKVVGQQYAKEVKYFERINGYSTTNILQNITCR